MQRAHQNANNNSLDILDGSHTLAVETPDELDIAAERTVEIILQCFPKPNKKASYLPYLCEFEDPLRKLMLHKMLKNNRYLQAGCNVTDKHIRAVLGDYSREEVIHNEMPEDDLGLTPFHYSVISGLVLN